MNNFEIFRDKTAVEFSYNMVKHDLNDSTEIEWDDLASKYFMMQPVPVESPVRNKYIDSRNKMMKNINRMAMVNREGWRLRVYRRGHSVVKESKSSMVESEVVRRFARIGSAFRMIYTALGPMIMSRGITEKDKMIIRQMINIQDGFAITMRGLASQLQVDGQVMQQIQNQIPDATSDNHVQDGTK